MVKFQSSARINTGCNGLKVTPQAVAQFQSSARINTGCNAILSVTARG